MNEQEKEEKAIQEYLTYLKVQKGYSPYTIISYQKDINSFMNFIHKEEVSLFHADIDIIRKYLEEERKRGISKVTLKRRLVSLRGLYQRMLDKKLIHTNVFINVATPKAEKKLPHFLYQEEIDLLFSENKKRTDKLKDRDQAILEILFDTGMRVSELCSLKMIDLNLNRRHIRVLGKGRKERIVTFTISSQKALDTYIKGLRNELLLNRKKDTIETHLFLNEYGEPLTSRGVEYILTSIEKKLGLGLSLHPHKFRHSFATAMLNNGNNLLDIQHLLGHESLGTTQIYTHISSKKMHDDYFNYFPRSRKNDE